MDALLVGTLVNDENDYKVLVLTSSEKEGYVFDEVIVKKIMTFEGMVAIEEHVSLMDKQILVKRANVTF